MLAIARGLMSKPKLMMLDEPSLGLMPSLSVKVIEILKRISSNGTTILLVEQKVRDALELADRAYVLQTGAIVQEGSGADLLKATASVKPTSDVMGIGNGFPKEEEMIESDKNSKSPFSKLHHLSVVVRNMDEAIKFYESIGIGPLKTIPL